MFKHGGRFVQKKLCWFCLDDEEWHHGQSVCFPPDREKAVVNDMVDDTADDT